ncbi:ferrous iron transport protein A [Pirellulales bacterium]|jgi:ferrous iron transport protein A|nr:ferrous iron transport protein A [Pirellulales bacterium]
MSITGCASIRHLIQELTMRSLATVNIGSTTQVVDISGDDNTSLRLLEMGLTPGVEVTIVGAAPLGDPVELELRGYRLSIRRNEAARVVVAT